MLADNEGTAYLSGHLVPAKLFVEELGEAVSFVTTSVRETVTYLNGLHVFGASRNEAGLHGLKLFIAVLPEPSLTLQITHPVLSLGKDSPKVLALNVGLLEFRSQGVGRLVQLDGVAHELFDVVVERADEFFGDRGLAMQALAESPDTRLHSADQVAVGLRGSS